MFDGSKLFELADTVLCGKTTYSKTVIEDAPASCDCLTSIYYLFKTYLSSDSLDSFFGLYYIGDMPRLLTKAHSWKILSVNKEDLLAGDLIFVTRKTKAIAIDHVGMYITRNTIFHCSKKEGTAVFQTTEEFFRKYRQNFTSEEMISSKDPRKWGLLSALPKV